MSRTERRPLDGLEERFPELRRRTSVVRPFEIPGKDTSLPVEALLDLHNARLKVFDPPPGFFASPSGNAIRAAVRGPVCSKGILYARPGGKAAWSAAGLRREAQIEGFFGDGAPAELWTWYADGPRGRDPHEPEHDRVVELAQAAPASRSTPRTAGLETRAADAAAAPALTALLRATFPDYPVPLEEVQVRRWIERGSHRYRLVTDRDGEIVAAACAEIDRERRNAELTDCATLPRVRRRGLMQVLLAALEEDLAGHDRIFDLYTIARAGEPGINRAFARLGYRYTGRLIHNCRMPLGWETMHVWCKRTRA